MKKAIVFFFIVCGLSGCYVNKTRLLDFPDTRQSYDYSCGPAAVQSVLAYYGEDILESRLIDLLKTDKTEGTYIKDIVNFLQQSGYSTDVKQKMTLVELFKYINNRIPVIVMIQAWGNKADFINNYKDSWNDGHFAVVIGYTKKEVLLSDPALFGTGYIPIQEFVDRWHDYDEGENKTYQTGIAVYGKEPRFDPQKYERIE